MKKPLAYPGTLSLIMMSSSRSFRSLLLLLCIQTLASYGCSDPHIKTGMTPTAHARDFDIEVMVADSSVEGRLWSALLDFGNPSISRKELLLTLQSIDKDSPNSKYSKEIRYSVDLLQKMISEDEQYSLNDLEVRGERTSQETIRRLIFELRDQNGQQVSQPGRCNIFLDERGENSPAHRLVKIGYEAVPQLIDALDDERFTRSVSYWRDYCFSHHILRVGDCIHDIVCRISGVTFWEPSNTNAGMVKDGEAKSIKIRAKTWWQEFQEKGEKQMLLEGVERGDRNSVELAKRLKERFPNRAFQSISHGIVKSADMRVRVGLIDILEHVPGRAVTDFLKQELSGPLADSRAAAAKCLLARGCDDGIQVMIDEWNQRSLNNDWRSGWKVVLRVLAESGRLEPVKAISRRVQTQPVQVRIAVVESFNPDWRKSRSNVTEDEGIGRAIDEMIVNLLDDLDTHQMVIGGTGGKECRDPRVCDMACYVLSVRWNQPELFDLYAPEEVRNSQRDQVRKAWIKFQTNFSNKPR